MWEGGRCVPAQEEKGRKRRGGASVCGGGVRWCACGGRGRATFVTITRTSQPHKVRSSLLVSRLSPPSSPSPFHHLPSPRAHLGNTEIEEPPDEPRRRMDRHRLRQRSPPPPPPPVDELSRSSVSRNNVLPPRPHGTACAPPDAAEGEEEDTIPPPPPPPLLVSASAFDSPPSVSALVPPSADQNASMAVAGVALTTGGRSVHGGPPPHPCCD